MATALAAEAMASRIEKLETLTEKEKQTLRLIVRGHDAKSIARSFDLSVHTINERLRDARRKLAVSSSREAARLLLEAEDEGQSAYPETHGNEEIGGVTGTVELNGEPAPVGGARRTDRGRWITGGVLVMLLSGLLALAALPQLASSPPSPVATSSPQAPNTEVVDAARQWLLLVDQGRWDESYWATGDAFRKLNTVGAWTTASQNVRVPLGAVVVRTFASQEDTPTPHYYELVKFRTDFANRANLVETVALDREDGRWRVVGITIG